MPKIQTVLASGGTSLTDFTLHDAGHSFRVAQRMAEVIPSDVLPELSAYELVLLLLSAYLHDIGMTPEQRKVRLHYGYILTGVQEDGLTKADTDTLQGWLDDDQRAVTPPIAIGAATPEDLQLANQLTTHYCRFRHNDWGEEWIRNHLTGEQLGTYSGWLDDLVRLCRSHHVGKPELLRSDFDPRPVGSPAAVVNFRYLACVLRVADILEFDPERTPEVILRHRDVAPGSLIYWYKDHEISLLTEGARIRAFARPSSARVHRAIETMLDDIDRELQVCRTLADETHFENCPGLTEKLPHRWVLESSLHRDLRPKPGTYEYIDGAFRPNTHKLLQLLSGAELYGNPLVAVRELLQNAFDAVKEQIAYQRLACTTPGDLQRAAELRRLHHVELQLQVRADGSWLTCTDTGVGMTREIITNHFLVSGQPRRHDVLALERSCRDAGISLERTGQFGLGVLSYFMMADRVVLWTRRSLEAGGDEPSGWRFETEGVGSFGELRRDATLTGGSRVELHLRAEQSADPEGWFSKLRSYLEATLCVIPCGFELTTSLPGCASLSLDPGWVLGGVFSFADLATREWGAQEIQEIYESVPPDLLSVRRRTELESDSRRVERRKAEAIRRLRWVHKEGELPDGNGRYRLHLPYFEHASGISLVYLDVRETRDGLALTDAEGALQPAGCTRVSWRGMRVNDVDGGSTKRRAHIDNLMITEVDFWSDRVGTLLVNRNELQPGTAGKASLGWLRMEAKKLVREFVQSRQASIFASLNAAIAEVHGIVIREPRWVNRYVKNGDDWDLVWGAVSFPATCGTMLPRTRGKVTWRGRSVELLETLYIAPLEYEFDPVPDRVVACNSSRRTRIVPLWTKNPFRASETPTEFPTAYFPPRWRTLCGIHLGDLVMVVWSRRHALVRAVTPAAWAWTTDMIKGSRVHLDPLSKRQDLLADRSRGAAWILRMISSPLYAGTDVWTAVRERDPSFLPELWRLVFGSSGVRGRATEVCFLDQGEIERSEPELRVLTPSTWSETEDASEIVRSLPDPGSEWRLEFGSRHRRHG